MIDQNNVVAAAIEAQAEETTEQVETASDASVEIARIEADREVAIAEIQAEAAQSIEETHTEGRIVEAAIEAENKKEGDEWQTNLLLTMNSLLAEIQTLPERTAQLIRTALTEPQQSLSESESESVDPTQGNPVDQEVPARPRPRRWI